MLGYHSVIVRRLILSLLLIGVAACASPDPEAAPVITDVDEAAVSQLTVHVFRSETCGCCHQWMDYMSAYGATVTDEIVADTVAIKEQAGVPVEAWSCHTSEVDGYTIEGHVPAQAIVDLLAQRPDAIGLALPGMPEDSPGMGPATRDTALQVMLINSNGSLSPFGVYRP